MSDAALDCGGLCADLLTEGLDFAGIRSKLLLSTAGCKREIVNSKLLPQRKKLAIGYLLALPEPILRTIMTSLKDSREACQDRQETPSSSGRTLKLKAVHTVVGGR
jgi:hypothetical protein